MLKIDARGEACPQPVLMAMQALEQGKEGEFILIVDNPSSCENVERFVRSQGCLVEVEKREQEFYLHIKKVNFNGEADLAQRKEKAKKIVVYISSNLLGIGDEVLGSFLMKSFLKTLLDLKTKPIRLILINSGVQLASEGSKVLETLKALSSKGVEILSCGTCLDFYGLKGKLRVGVISNMYEIIQSMMEADYLIRP